MAIDLRPEWFDETTTAAFDANIDRSDPDGCWPWTGSIDNRGRGYFDLRISGRRQRVSPHRVAVMLARGDSPHRQIVSSCGLRACCRPDHWATKGDDSKSRPVTVYRPQLPPQTPDGPHPWLGVIAEVDAHPHGQLADLVAAAVRRVHDLQAGAGWADIGEAVCHTRKTAAQLRDAYLKQYLALGGLAAEAA